MQKSEDIVHSFPKSVDRLATKFGQWSTKIGGDGESYQWLEIDRCYAGKSGTFEFIKDPKGVIDLRYLNIH